MYISSYLTLDTALSGVEAAQEELDTTGENISNETTTDYEEQSVNLVESPSLDIAGSGGAGALQLGKALTRAALSTPVIRTSTRLGARRTLRPTRPRRPRLTCSRSSRRSTSRLPPASALQLSHVLE